MLKLLKDISDENGFLISTTRERAETLKAALDELGADAEIDVTWDEDWRQKNTQSFGQSLFARLCLNGTK